MNKNDMKTIILLLFCCCMMSLHASPKTRETSSSLEKKILIITPEANVTSNYYSLDMIAEELNIGQDSVGSRLNGIVTESMAECDPIFVVLNGKSTVVEELLKNIKVVEQPEKVSVADLLGVSEQDFKNLIRETGVDYVLVINGYFLNKQEQPFNTIFHTISFSMYDKNKKSILTDTNSYNTIALNSCEKIKEASKKCTKRMVKNILKEVSK